MPHICPVCKCHCECGGDNKDDVNRGELSRCYCCQGFEGGGCDDEEEPGIDDMPEFIPCARCDGHPACEEHGCAFAAGLGHLVERENPWDVD